MNRKNGGFTLIEIIVAIIVMAVLAGAIAPVVYKQIDQARTTRILQDLESIYEATMGQASEDYFGYVGDVGNLPDSIPELIDSTGHGPNWNGPYLSLGGSYHATDIYGNSYVIDSIPIRTRSYGANGVDDGGTGDDLIYPDNALTTYSGRLEAQVLVNGRIIQDDVSQQVSADLNYFSNGSVQTMNLTFDSNKLAFVTPASVHQGKHVLTVEAAKAVEDPATEVVEVVTIYPGATTTTQITMSDADYMSRLDTDLNGNGIPDRQEDLDGDGIPDSMDNDMDGDGTPDAIDPDSLDPTVTGGAGAAAPVVNNVTPSYGTQGDNNLSLTIDGLYFQDGATVAFSGTGITVLTSPATFNGASQLVVSVNIDGAASTTFRDVTVTNPNQTMGVGEDMFEVVSSGGLPAPVVTQASPSQVYQEDTSVPISIQGQNFQSGATVTFSNGGVSIVSGPTYVSSNEVTVSVSVSQVASTGQGTVRLTNPDGKYDETPFTVNALVPNISQLSPNTATRNTNNVQVTVSGSNFSSQAQINTGGSYSDRLTLDWFTYNSSTQMTFQADAGFVFFWEGQLDIYIIVTNPGGAADTATFTLTR